MPDVGTINKFGETWDGSRWQMAGRTPAAGRGNSPPTESNSEGLKQMLTTAGLVAGGALAPEIEGPALLARYFPTLLRVGGAMVGGAAGRMLGHAPEAAVSATTGRPNSSTFAGDAMTGAIEGGTAELLPAVTGPVLRGSGRALRAAGRIFGDVPGSPAWQRSAAAAARGITARELGLPGVLQGAAAGGPVAASELGRGAEALGDRVGSGTLSERVEGAIGALRRRLSPVVEPTRRETLDAGAERYAGRRIALAQQQAAAARGSGLAADLGERVPVRSMTPVPQAAPGEGLAFPPESLELDRLLKRPTGGGPAIDALRDRTTPGVPSPDADRFWNTVNRRVDQVLPAEVRPVQPGVGAARVPGGYGTRPVESEIGDLASEAAPTSAASVSKLKTKTGAGPKPAAATAGGSDAHLEAAYKLMQDAKFAGLPIDPELASAVEFRNRTGRWPTE